MNGEIELNTRRASVWKRITNWLGFEKSISQDDDPVEVSGADALQKVDKLIRVEISNNLDENRQNIEEAQHRITEQFTALGKTEGAMGMSSQPMRLLAFQRAQRFASFIQRQIEPHLNGAKRNLAIWETKFEQLTNNHAAAKNYFEEIRESYRSNYKKYSILLGVLYLVVSVILLFADGMLAYNIITEVFQFGNVPGYVVAAGVAAVTFYVKIFYDEFIGSPLKTYAIQYPHADLRPDAENAARAKRIGQGRLWIKLFVLLLTLNALFWLGYLRLQVKGDVGMDELSSLPAAMPAYLSLALLFPMVSGICASLGLDCIQNHRQYAKADEDFSKSASRMHESEIKRNEQQEQVAALQAEWEYFQPKGLFVEEVASAIWMAYSQGYEMGIAQAPEMDLFTLAKSLRNKSANLEGQHMLNQLKASLFQDFHTEYSVTDN